MVSGIDDPLHRRWTQPGQTLRGRVNHRTREPLLKNSQSYSERLAESCLAVNIMVTIMKLLNCRFSVIKSVYENDSNENDCVRARDGGGAEPCSAARADDAGGPGQGGRDAVRQVRRPGAGDVGEIRLEAR